MANSHGGRTAGSTVGNPERRDLMQGRTGEAESAAEGAPPPAAYNGAPPGPFDRPAVILRPDRRRLGRIALTSLALAVFGHAEGGAFGEIGAGFFGACTVCMVTLMLPQAAYLRLESDGFTWCWLFRKHRSSWTDVAGFTPVNLGRLTLVAFDDRVQARRSPRTAAASVAFMGRSSAPPDTFGLSAADLAALMNFARAAHSAASADADIP